MKYNVFKIDDPDTWPQYNCPILVWRKNHDYPYVYQWDPTEHCFLNDYDTYYPDTCFYTYIGYRPYIEKELHPKKCHNGYWECELYDDGYCLWDGRCKDQKEVTEYSIGIKQIWKSF